MSMEIRIKKGCYYSVRKRPLNEFRSLAVYRVYVSGAAYLSVKVLLDPTHRIENRLTGTDYRLVYDISGSSKLCWWWHCQIKHNLVDLNIPSIHGLAVSEDSLDLIKEITLLKPSFKLAEKLYGS